MLTTVAISALPAEPLNKAFNTTVGLVLLLAIVLVIVIIGAISYMKKAGLLGGGNGGKKRVVVNAVVLEEMLIAIGVDAHEGRAVAEEILTLHSVADPEDPAYRNWQMSAIFRQRIARIEKRVEKIESMVHQLVRMAKGE